MISIDLGSFFIGAIVGIIINTLTWVLVDL